METLLEGIGDRTLSKQTKKYYDFVMKKLPKYEEKAKNKEKYKDVYKKLKNRSKKLKDIYIKAKELEKIFFMSDEPKEKVRAKREYRDLGEDAKEILKDSKKDYNKLKNILIASGIGGTAIATIIALISSNMEMYDDYMHSFHRFCDIISGNTIGEKITDRLENAREHRRIKNIWSRNFFNY